jgi:soluble lytic murein transglycosylase-like protein
VGAARATWGLNAPVATFAAQVHQESGWRPDARSRFAGGLAQFTPDTAEWISQAYAGELGANQPFNPAWALRALVRYDLHLWALIRAVSDCDRMAMALAAYNGGLGWVQRDQRLAVAAGADPMRWWGHVERHTARADWAREENRGYPRRILLQLQPRYKAWGLGVLCPAV